MEDKRTLLSCSFAALALEKLMKHDERPQGQIQTQIQTRIKAQACAHEEWTMIPVYDRISDFGACQTTRMARMAAVGHDCTRTLPMPHLGNVTELHG
jgi:hypothetical protein